MSDRWSGRLADIAFVGVLVTTAAYYLRLTRGLFFAYDEWMVAARPGGLGDLLEPHNGHLIALPLIVYRTLYRLVGMEHHLPFRLLGTGALLVLSGAIFLLARHRLGPWPGLVVACAVLWAPSVGLTPFLSPFYASLTLGVACAAALPSKSKSSDVVIAAAVSAALCTSGVGVAVAAACIVHTALGRSSLRRAVAVGAPTAAWCLWWLSNGGQNRPPTSTAERLRTVWEGTMRSFEVPAFGSVVAGALLGLATLALLAWRIANDRESARSQAAWLAGLIVWWAGLTLSRVDATGSNDATRYQIVGGVLIVISLLPSHPTRFSVRPAVRPYAPVAALLLVVLVAAVNRPSIAQAARNRVTLGTWASNVLVEVDLEPPVVTDDQRLPPFFGTLTAGELRALFERRGDAQPTPPDPDTFLLRQHAVRVALETGTSPSGACLPQPVALTADQWLRVDAGSRPTDVSAHRFGPTPVHLRTVAPDESVTVRPWGPTVAPQPWLVEAPGRCVQAIAPPG